jgi:hypothetical protein
VALTSFWHGKGTGLGYHRIHSCWPRSSRNTVPSCALDDSGDGEDAEFMDGIKDL